MYRNIKESGSNDLRSDAHQLSPQPSVEGSPRLSAHTYRSDAALEFLFGDSVELFVAVLFLLEKKEFRFVDEAVS